MNSKDASRRRIREQRLSEQPTTEPSGIQESLGQLVSSYQKTDTSGSPIIAAYAPLPGEPGGEDLPEFLLGTGAHVILPRIAPIPDARERGLRGTLAQHLEWVEYTGGNLATGTWGIREPIGRAIPNIDEICQLFAVPALAVDHRGYRLGQGGGFYDRAFASFSTRPRFAGNIYAIINDEEFVPEIPAEPHDLQVDAVITPSGVHTIARSSSTLQG